MVGGVQLGNVWIGVQPALGLEGDPMRLLFEKGFTPHPQYAGDTTSCQRCCALCLRSCIISQLGLMCRAHSQYCGCMKSKAPS